MIRRRTFSWAPALGALAVGGGWLLGPGCNQLLDISDAPVVGDAGDGSDGGADGGGGDGGSAECGSLSIGEAACEGAERSVCTQDGLQTETCPSAQHCQFATGTECAVCLPNEFRCDDTMLSECNAEHTGFDVVDDCTDEPCNAEAGACTSDACLPDQRRCAGDDLELCNEDQTAFELLEECGVGLCNPETFVCDECSGASCETCSDPEPTMPDTTFECQSGEWVITDCPTDTLHCDTDLENGCETDANSIDNCGTCGTACSFACNGGTCDELTAVGAGWDHACATTSSGAAYCWGRNQAGQLGDDSKIDRDAPGAVTDLPSGATQVAGGELHTCAIVGAANDVYCWGSNSSGQLGAGSITESLVPVRAGTFTGAISVDAGRLHSCATLGNGNVRCWGQREFGRLGTGLTGAAVVNSPQNALLPGDLPFTDAAQVATGEQHTCVRHSGGTVSCFGNNSVGQLGTGGTADPQGYAQAVSGLSGVVDLKAGAFHTCAATDAGTYCWGLNGANEVGQASGTFHPTPQLVAALASQVSVGTGYAGTCAVAANGGLTCWGSNDEGERGEPPSAASHEPTTVDLDPVDHVTSHGVNFVCALTQGGQGFCFGRANYGQLGNRSDSSTHLPQLLSLNP